MHLLKDLGSEYYLSLLKISNGIIGNSSSGILEAPSLNVPTINIGNRQKGRPRSKSIIDVDFNKYELLNAVKKTISKNFLLNLKNNKNPFYKKNAIDKTVIQIKKFLKKKKMEDKKFYDIDFKT